MQLNVEQKRIIQSKPNGHSLIKGVAGSGKTTVAVNKIPILLDYYCPESDDRVLMATYNKSLSRYVSFIYENVKKERETQAGFFDNENEGKLEIKTIDSLIYSYFNEYKKENNSKLKLATNEQSKKALIDAIRCVAKEKENIKIIDTKFFNFIKEEIQWMKGCNYIELEVYQSVDRIGRVSKKNGETPQKLRKNSEQRGAIYEVLIEYNKNLLKDGLLDFQDIQLIALNQVAKSNKKRYTHILIDESQDLSRIQLEFLKALYNEKPYSSLTFIADVAQSIYAQAWLVKNRSFTSIGYDMTGKSSSLSKNYRTTTQISEAAFSLIRNDKELIEDKNFVKPSLIDRQGQYPIYKRFANETLEAEYISNLINSYLKNKYKLRDIVVIARLNNQLNEMKNYLDKAGIPATVFTGRSAFDFAEESVKLVTMHSIKGLEFKVVLAIGLNSKTMPYISGNLDDDDVEVIEARERKLLYVGMTRATEMLYLTSSDKPSKFIKDIDYQYLRIKEGCNIRRISSIPINNYMFKEKIKDIYSEEEKVRQWILRELVEVYKYRSDLLTIEEKINIGSKQYFADIAVNTYKDNVKVPYILIETKKWGTGIEDALRQLQSYMSNCLSAKYGIATDGNELVIIDRDLSRIDDIPKFDSNMMPSSLESNEYIDLARQVTHKFIKDNSASEIYIEENGIENKVTDLRTIPIYNEIAAGAPILINEEFAGKYMLPAQWVNNLEELFLLKIKGHSMINKNINDGDYVVIKKQNYADIGDIVAVDIDGNATLKTYRPMGGKILLVPENNEYEPIMLDEEQITIIGIAVGIIKEN